MRTYQRVIARTYSNMVESAMRRPRRFAPLAADSTSEAPKLRGIVFDVDGTLCEPQNYMFGEMRSALGIDKSTDILEHVYALPTPQDQEAAMSKIVAIEEAAMKVQKPQPGLAELMTYLEARNVQKAICTRNLDRPVEHLLSKFLPERKFEPIITRAFRPPKPDPAGILHIAGQWKLQDGAEGLIMVGDSIDDMTAGRKAGAATVLLVNEVNKHLSEHPHTDLIIKRLDELVDILEQGFASGEDKH